MRSKHKGKPKDNMNQACNGNSTLPYLLVSLIWNRHKQGSVSALKTTPDSSLLESKISSANLMKEDSPSLSSMLLTKKTCLQTAMFS